MTLQYPIGREKECEKILSFVADTAICATNKVLAIVGNCGCGKTSSLFHLAQNIQQKEGFENFHRIFQKSVASSSSSSFSGLNQIRTPHFEYLCCADLSSKVLLSTLNQRLQSFFPNSSSSSSSSSSTSFRKKNSKNDDEIVSAASKQTLNQLEETLWRTLGSLSTSLNSNNSNNKNSIKTTRKALTVQNQNQNNSSNNPSSTNAMKNSNNNNNTTAHPFGVLILDEVDAAGHGWSGERFRRVVDKILDFRCIALIVIANRKELPELPRNNQRVEYLTFESYKSSVLVDIMKNKTENQNQNQNNSSNNNNSAKGVKKSSSSSSSSSSVAFQSSALALVAGTVVAEHSGDARKVIDYCKASAAIKNQQQQQQNQNQQTSSVRGSAKAKANQPIEDQKRTRQEQEQEEESNNNVSQNQKKKTTSTSTTNNNARTEVSAGDMNQLLKATQQHPGIQMIPFLPQHTRFALCCIVNASKNAALSAANGNSLVRNGSSSRGSGGGGGGGGGGGQQQSHQQTANFMLQNIYVLYQRLAKELQVTVVSIGVFREMVGSLVDIGILSSNGTKFALLVHITEIEAALKEAGAMYHMADRIIKCF